MKRALHFILLSAFIILFNLYEAEAQTVYVTKTGTKYHRSSCRYLKYSAFSLALSDAKQKGYEACSVCRPTADETNVIEKKSSPVYSPSQLKNATASQCTGTTKAGNRCKRTTANSNGRCYQH